MNVKAGLSRWMRRSKTGAYPPDTVHFLHVGKAAGTQIGSVVRQVNESRSRRKLVTHGHKVELKDLPDGHDYFFSTRDPIARFRSGFYSRQRKGQPRNYFEWSEHERLAFSRFSHANDLAEALFSPGKVGRDAVAAIRSIQHCSRNLVDWFKFSGHMFDLRPPVWIIRQEHFATDLEVFLQRVGHDGPVNLAQGKHDSHSFDYEGVPDLSVTAKANLRRWYVQDYEFLNLCETWMADTINSVTYAARRK